MNHFDNHQRIGRNHAQAIKKQQQAERRGLFSLFRRKKNTAEQHLDTDYQNEYYSDDDYAESSEHRRYQNRTRDHQDYDDSDNYDSGSDHGSYEDGDDDNEPPKKRTWLRSLFWFGVKSFIAVGSLVAIYGVYLDSIIRDRLDGAVWQLPVAVYSRTINLEPGSPYTVTQLTQLLQSMQYRQVTRVIRSGEFTVNKDSTIEIWRREFAFPDVKEGIIKAKVYFNKNSIQRIENLETGRELALFRIDPRLITLLQSPNGEQRLFVERERFPETLVDILIATEDRNFYNHEGVSLYSIGRAVVANLVAGNKVQGGSTLTQQLVKNIFLSNERSYKRKINEAYMALILDARYGKERILELYLNEVYLGQIGDEEIRGFPLASLYYFGRSIDEISVDQQAMLVGMVKGAGVYNPWTKPENTIKRRNVVLKIMQNLGYLDQASYDMFSARPLDVRPRGGVISPQPAFMQMVRNDLGIQFTDEKLKLLSGAKIFTTLDPVTQDAAEKSLQQGIPELRTSTKLNDIEAASVIVDRFTGEIRAMVGGSDTQFAGYNRALLARRSIGSLAKPAVYLSALSQPDNYRLNTVLKDEPISLKQPNGSTWSPNNYDRKFRGSVLLVDALAKSLNIPTVNVGLAVGLKNVDQQLLNLGVPEKQITSLPSVLLGAINLTPIEVAQMYQTIASGGNRALLSSVRVVMDENNQVLYQSFPQATTAVLPEAAYLTLYGMQQVVERGTGRALLTDFSKAHLAGKTGTTNDLIDSWYAGIDGKEVAIFWVGRDNNQSSKLTGTSGALKIYQHYLANQAPMPLNIQRPTSIADIYIDDAGNFSCYKTSRTIPVWTNRPNEICQQQNTYSNYGSGYDANTPQNNAATFDENGNLILQQNQINTPSPNQHLLNNQPQNPPANSGQNNQNDSQEWLNQMFGQ